MSSVDRERVKAILAAHILHLGLVIDSHLQFPASFPYDVLGRHVVALSVDDVHVSERGIAAKVSVSIQALLDYPPVRAREIDEDRSRRHTKVSEFTGTVQLQATGAAIEEFDDLKFVPPALLLSWPNDL